MPEEIAESVKEAAEISMGTEILKEDEDFMLEKKIPTPQSDIT